VREAAKSPPDFFGNFAVGANHTRENPYLDEGIVGRLCSGKEFF
jgi:hypothetical protein